MSAFLEGVQTGASVMNMRRQREERMIALRSQQAMQQIRERESAAQVQALTEQTALDMQNRLQKKEAQEQETKILQEASDHFEFLTNEMGMESDEADKIVIGAASRLNPDVGEKMANAYLKLKQAEKASAIGEGFTPKVSVAYDESGKPYRYFQSSPNQARLIDESGNLGTEAKPVTDTEGNVLGWQVPGARGPHYFSKKDSGPGFAAKEEIKNIYSRIETLQNKYDQMKDKTLLRQPNSEKEKLGVQIETLKKEARDLEKAPAPAKPASDKVRVQHPDGRTGSIPASQLQEALAQGFKEVK